MDSQPLQGDSTFHRARTDEQRQERTSAIHSSARSALATTDVSGVTLRRISAGAALAPSNVLRYVGSRESLLLDILSDEYVAWLTELSDHLDGEPRSVDEVADALAVGLAARPILCRLVAAAPELLRGLRSADAAERARNQGVENGAAVAALLASSLQIPLTASDGALLTASLHASVTAAAAFADQTVFPVTPQVAIRELVAIQLEGFVARAANRRRS